MIEKYRQQIVESINKEFNINPVVEQPKKADSDLSIPLFGYAKQLNKKLPEVFELFKNTLNELAFIENITFMSGFLNIYFKRDFFTKSAMSEITNKLDKFGENNKRDETIVIDYSSPNIAKNFSVGHLRSTVIGNSLKNIYVKLGYDVVGINYLGDWGVQFGKIIVAYQNWVDEEAFRVDPVKELQRIYVKFHDEAKSNPKLEDEAREAFVKLENNDQEYLEYWKLFREKSLESFMKTYKLLDVTFDSYLGEAYYNDKIPAVVDELEEKQLLTLDDGAQVVMLDGNMPPALIRKQDGATLYMTRDVAAILDRYRKYNFTKTLYVVGSEQKLHFEQLKQVVKKMGYDFDIEHINFGLVLYQGKKMSTREGVFADLYKVIQTAIESAKETIDEKNPNLENKDYVAQKVAVGAIIFNDLKNERHLDIDFDLNQMLRFEGNTGPYVQYTIVRIRSILKNTNVDFSNLDLSLLSQDIYYEIIKEMAQLPSTIMRAASTNNPSVIAKYLINLSQMFNRFYANVKINDANELTRNTNLNLIYNLNIVLSEGLRLLGITPLEEM